MQDIRSALIECADSLRALHDQVLNGEAENKPSASQIASSLSTVGTRIYAQVHLLERLEAQQRSGLVGGSVATAAFTPGAIAQGGTMGQGAGMGAGNAMPGNTGEGSAPAAEHPATTGAHAEPVHT